MTRTMEAALERRQAAEQKNLLRAVYGGLVDAIGDSGGELERLSIRMTTQDVLLTMVARFPAGFMVCHVGSGDLASVLVRAAREAGRGSLSWREDKYRSNGG